MMIECKGCEQTRKHKAKGFCSNCYDKNRRANAPYSRCPVCGETKQLLSPKWCRSCCKQAYYDSNVEQLKAYAADWYKENADWVVERNKARREANPGAARAIRDRARAKRLEAEVGYWPDDVHAQLQKAYGFECMKPECTKYADTVDHVVPLALSGLHCISNAQLLCRSHNSSKNSRSCADYRPFVISPFQNVIKNNQAA